jgi:methylenetetrahydrofolate reductase (NADH)
METLQEKLFGTSRFLVGVELVSIRGSMQERNAIKARTFAGQLAESSNVDWISVTDNAGGNPQLAPITLGKPILYAGKEVVIHLTCKDLNRNGLESEAWQLHSEGFHNVLAMTGDYPVTGNGGLAKPVFDIDSVGLISMLEKMNRGFDDGYERTQFCIGAVTTNYKMFEGEVVPQYLKLEKKIECGARFIINQVGFDAHKMEELILYMQRHGISHIPLIGNVYLLNHRVAKVFHEGKIPGIVVTSPLRELCEKQSQSPDSGKAFFLEFAAKQVSIYRALGYRGVYIGGVNNVPAVEKILEIERTFSRDDWKQFAREISFSRPGEFFFYSESNTLPHSPAKKSTRVNFLYRFSRWTHNVLFTPDRPLSKLGKQLIQSSHHPEQGPRPLRALEILSKSILFKCKDCGDCSLPDIAFLCPESQCAKNQRNGPCGGTKEGKCEVDGFGDCIWLRAYERLQYDGKEKDLLNHAPVVQDQGLRGTSAWANFWLRRDHSGKKSLAIRSENRTQEKNISRTSRKEQPVSH